MHRKRLLIITYYWPPSGGVGVHRCLKFAKYLREFGWEPVVFTAKNAQYPVFDESNFKHIPEGTEIHQIPIFEPFSLFKNISGRKPEDSPNPVYVRDKKRSWVDEFAIWVRGNFFIPDARALWIRPAVKYISSYLRQNNTIDAIFSDGPPHTNTRIAWHISRKFNLPWLADFQDPWTQVDYYKLLKITRFANIIHRKMEQQVFRQAKQITIASPSWASDLEKIGASNVKVLYYGYDEEDFRDTETASPEFGDLRTFETKFVINHAGLLGMDRFPETFLKLLSELCSEVNDFREDLKMYFPGEVDYSIRSYIEKLKLDSLTVYPGHVSKAKAIKSMKMSRILLLPLNQADNAKGRLPGKVYEYLRSYTPILALGPEDSDVNKILKDTKTGVCVHYDDRDQIRDFVLREYFQFKEKKRTEACCAEKIREYDVKNQTSKLAEYLNQIYGKEQ